MLENSYMKIECKSQEYTNICESIKLSLDNTLNCNKTINNPKKVFRTKYRDHPLNITELCQLIIFGFVLYFVIKYWRIRMKKMN